MQEDRKKNFIKKGIWIYFFLLLFEGALRKWFFPGLATPLLVVRDPLAIYLIFLSLKYGYLPKNFYLTGMVATGIVSFFLTLLVGHGNISVAIFGLRVFVIHFPLIFIIGSVFEKKDVINLGVFTLYIAIPMAILTALQFYSPQSAWVNRGIGGDLGGAGFSGALGYFRPPGTFSFTNGNTLFFSFAACYAVYFWLDSKKINKILLIIATASILLAIPLSISRSLLFHVVISVIFAFLVVTTNKAYIGRILLSISGIILVIFLLSKLETFQTATEAFTTRFENANETEGGLEGVLMDRYLGGLIGALLNTEGLPIFGFGLGMGTNVGSMLLTGEIKFLISEGEWGRLIGELGPILGMFVIFIRIGLTLKIGLASYKEIQFGNLLPWLLFSAGLFTLPQAQWGQPTSLGFSILIGGLMIASFKDSQK